MQIYIFFFGRTGLSRIESLASLLSIILALKVSLAQEFKKIFVSYSRKRRDLTRWFLTYRGGMLGEFWAHAFEPLKTRSTVGSPLVIEGEGETTPVDLIAQTLQLDFHWRPACPLSHLYRYYCKEYTLKSKYTYAHSVCIICVCESLTFKSGHSLSLWYITISHTVVTLKAVI